MNHWTLLDLDLIGFSSVLEAPVLPRVLAPVYQQRSQPGQVLLPPFTQVGDEVFNAGRATLVEFESLIAQEKVSRLPKPVPAKISHDLWVNEEGQIAYDNKSAVKKAFEEIFRTHLARAQERFTAQDYASACRHAAVARAVKPSHIRPLVLRAAAELLMGQLTRAAFTRHLAEEYDAAEDFERSVQELTGARPADVRGSAVMCKAALRKSRFQLAAA